MKRTISHWMAVLCLVTALLSAPGSSAQNGNGTISGHKFHDRDGDGTWDADEPAIAGWTIYLDLDNDGARDEGEPSRLTDTAGLYSFTGLAPATYIVREEQRDGWIQTAPVASRSEEDEIATQGTLQLLRPDPTQFATFFGRGGVSIDALGTMNQGDLQAEVPAGSTVVRAYLHVATRGAQPASIPFNGQTVNLTWLANVDSGCCSFRTGMADVTTIAAARIGGGGGTFNFPVDEAATGVASSIEGTTLVVIYSNPQQPERSIAVLQGGLSGPEAQVNVVGLGAPVNPQAPGFTAHLSLAIQFGYQEGGNNGQYSTVDINGQRLTTSAGGQDDGFSGNGGLVTAGGLGDSPTNPPDPNARAQGFRYDDELYDLAPFLAQGDQRIEVQTSNPSNDDGIFLMVFLFSGRAAVAQEPGTHRVQLGAGQTVADRDFGNLRVGPTDTDQDGVDDDRDNCADVPNPDQANLDRDALGDACDTDADGDNVNDAFDNCPGTSNPTQSNQDGDAYGDACDRDSRDGPGSDADGDRILNADDNCDNTANADQRDSDGDGEGDACDADEDNDGRLDAQDNCPQVPNADQTNRDGDALGDACDDQPQDGPAGDLDGDTVPNSADNCDQAPNPPQTDSDGDGLGDECDPVNDGPLSDADRDGVPKRSDNCPDRPNGGQQDQDGDGRGDACDADASDGPRADADGDTFDNAAEQSAQSDPRDPQSVPDDRDGDGRRNGEDNCPAAPNMDQRDTDGDGTGDACDAGLPTITVDSAVAGAFDATITVRTSSGPLGLVAVELRAEGAARSESLQFRGPGPHVALFEGLDSARSYAFTIRASDYQGAPVASTSGSLQTQASAAPRFFASNVQAEQLPNGSVLVTWSVPFDAPGAADADGFLVWRSSSPFTLVGRVNEPDQRSFIDVSASFGKVYRYTVTFFTGDSPGEGAVQSIYDLPEYPGDENVPAGAPTLAGSAFAVGDAGGVGDGTAVILVALCLGFLIIVAALIVRKRSARDETVVVVATPRKGAAAPHDARPAKAQPGNA